MREDDQSSINKPMVCCECMYVCVCMYAVFTGHVFYRYYSGS